MVKALQFLSGFGFILCGTVRHATIGAVFSGHMDKLPKGQDLHVVWEVSWLKMVLLPNSVLDLLAN